MFSSDYFPTKHIQNSSPLGSGCKVNIHDITAQKMKFSIMDFFHYGFLLGHIY